MCELPDIRKMAAAQPGGKEKVRAFAKGKFEEGDLANAKWWTEHDKGAYEGFIESKAKKENPTPVPNEIDDAVRMSDQARRRDMNIARRSLTNSFTKASVFGGLK